MVMSSGAFSRGIKGINPTPLPRQKPKHATDDDEIHLKSTTQYNDFPG